MRLKQSMLKGHKPLYTKQVTRNNVNHLLRYYVIDNVYVVNDITASSSHCYVISKEEYENMRRYDAES